MALPVEVAHVLGRRMAGTFDLSGSRRADPPPARGRFEVEGLLHPGDPGEIIGAHVETYGVGLLVMGAYGRFRIRSLVIGSTNRGYGAALQDTGSDVPVSGRQACRQTFQPDTTSMAANAGRRISSGTMPSSMPPMKVPTIEPAAITSTNVRLRLITEKLSSAL